MPDLGNAQTHFQISTDNLFNTIIYEYNGPYTTTIDTTTLNLPRGETLYSRLRYYVPDIGYSNWSTDIASNFFSITLDANIIGIALVSSGNRTGNFVNIDWQGNFVNNFDYTTHPIYNSLSQVVIDGCTFMQVPTIYIKTAVSGPVGSSSEGCICWWISDKPVPGFRPAATFKRDGIIKSNIWWGTYLANTESVRTKTCLASKAGKTVAANKSKNTFEMYATNRNSGGYSGFRLFDIWDLSLFKMLVLIFGGGTDTQSIWGDNVKHTYYPKTGTTGSKALYMCDLWATYQWIADSIYCNNSRYLTFINPYDGSVINTTTIPGHDYGWIYSLCQGSFTIDTGNTSTDTHDLLELFIPDTLVATESEATFPDFSYIYPTSPNAWLVGGKSNDWDNAGLFNFDNTYYDNSGYSTLAARLAKS